MINNFKLKLTNQMIYLLVAFFFILSSSVTLNVEKNASYAENSIAYLYYNPNFSGGYSYFDASYEWWNNCTDDISIRFVGDYEVPAGCVVKNNINIDLNGKKLSKNSIAIGATVTIYDYAGGGKGLFTIQENANVTFSGSADSSFDVNINRNANCTFTGGRIVFMYFTDDNGNINSVLPQGYCFIAHKSTGETYSFLYKSGNVPLFNGTTSQSEIAYLSVEECKHEVIENGKCVYCNLTIDATEALKIARKELKEAREQLDNLIKTKADSATLSSAIDSLNRNIETAIERCEIYSDTQDSALREELQNAITTAKTEAISAATTAVNEAKAELEEKINAKASTEDLNTAINNLNAAIATATETSKAYAEEQDAALKEELQGAITAAKTEAMSAATTAVNEAKAELEEKINAKASTEDLNTAINNLNAAIETAQTISKEYVDTQDAVFKEQLEQEISEARAAIQNAIDLLSSRLTNVESKIDENAKEIATLKIITFVAGGVLFAFMFTTIIIFVVSKSKKHQNKMPKQDLKN